MRHLKALALVVLLLSFATSCGDNKQGPIAPDPQPVPVSDPQPAPVPDPPTSDPPPVPLPDPIPPVPLPQPPSSPSQAILVGAGDIGQCGSVETGLTAEVVKGVLRSSPFALAFTAGDNAYPNATDDNFRRCYDPTWGQFKDRTKPTPGNHDLAEGSDPTAYYRYFGAAAGIGYYSYEAGPWHVVSLNSMDDMARNSAQAAWLRQDLASHSTVCSLAYFHHPLFSSGKNGSQNHVGDIWRILYEAGVDVIASGHDHDYERFRPQDPDGRFDPARGIREFVVGTGGASLYREFSGLNNSEFWQSANGVIKFTLKSDSYDYEFIPVGGLGRKDFGTNEKCH